MQEMNFVRRTRRSFKMGLLVFVAAVLIFGLIAFQAAQTMAYNMAIQQSALVELSSPTSTASSDAITNVVQSDTTSTASAIEATATPGQ